MVVVLPTLAIVIFIVIIRMQIEIDVEVEDLPFVGVLQMMMVDDHRFGAHLIHRKDRNAENHENPQTTHDGQTGMAMPAILPGVGMVVGIFRMNHGKTGSQFVGEGSKCGRYRL